MLTQSVGNLNISADYRQLVSELEIHEEHKQLRMNRVHRYFADTKHDCHVLLIFDNVCCLEDVKEYIFDLPLNVTVILTIPDAAIDARQITLMMHSAFELKSLPQKKLSISFNSILQIDLISIWMIFLA